MICITAGDIVYHKRRPVHPDRITQMPSTRGFLLSCCTAGLIFAQAAPKKQLTARELFYAAPQAAAPHSAGARQASPAQAFQVVETPLQTAPVEIATAAAPAARVHSPRPCPPGGAPPLGSALHRPQTRRRRYSHRSPQRHHLPLRRPHTLQRRSQRPRLSLHHQSGLQRQLEAHVPLRPKSRTATTASKAWRPYTMPPGNRVYASIAPPAPRTSSSSSPASPSPTSKA